MAETLSSSSGLASELVLDLKGVSKTYSGMFGRKGVHALRGIDMQVRAGEIFGLLGPNGAGKSTLVKILMTVIRPTACEGSMLGLRVGDKRALRHVGYLPEHHRFPEYLTAAQVLDFFGAMSDVDRATRKRRSGELLELLGISKWTTHRVKGFSKGMRQRLGIAAALIMDPAMVVLDEPTDGVDPLGRRDIRMVLQELKRQGRTVFLNSHLLSELEMVSDRVAILVQGRVHAQGTIDELTKRSRRYELEVYAPGSPGAALSTQSVVNAISTLARASIGDGYSNEHWQGSLKAHTDEPVSVLVRGGHIEVATDDPERVQAFVDSVRGANLAIKSMRPVRQTLEDLFVEAVTDPITGKELKPGASDEPKGRG